MHQEGAAKPLSNADLTRILSPLLLFVAHFLYLAFWSAASFFQKWIDGSFSFFLSLVLCNIIRSRVVAAAESRGPADHGREDGAP
jgi:hypothetical protein